MRCWFVVTVLLSNNSLFWVLIILLFQVPIYIEMYHSGLKEKIIYDTNQIYM